MMSIWKDAEARGELVYRFRQSESPLPTRSGPSGLGLGSRISTLGAGPSGGADREVLALRWAGLRAADLDFDYDRQTLRLDGIPDRRVTGEPGPGGGASLLSTYGLASTRYYNCQYQPIGHSFAHAAKKDTGLFHISLQRDGSVHDVAMQSEDFGTHECYRYFDPNYGHFKFDSPHRFTEWMDDFLKNISGYYNRFYRFRIDILQISERQRESELMACVAN